MMRKDDRFALRAVDGHNIFKRVVASAITATAMIVTTYWDTHKWIVDDKSDNGGTMPNSVF